MDMKIKSSDWYKKSWSLDIKQLSWVEETQQQIEFIIKTLNLTGKERILDIACGFGRHSLLFAERGYRVTGVDITQAYVNDARKNAEEKGLNAEFICSDVRNIRFKEEFDVVLNLADGAIGYLENDAENLKAFDVISNALVTGGKSFMDVNNAAYAEAHFPFKTWEAGANALSLADFEWDKENRRMLYGSYEYVYGKPAAFPEYEAATIRLYHKDEIQEILGKRNMSIKNTFSTYTGEPDSINGIQLMIHSEKHS